MGKDGFGQVLRGEWTKFRTVRSTAICMVIMFGLTLLLSLFVSSVGSTNANEGPQFSDELHFVHQPLSGDGTVIARVASQDPSHEWAKAGIMIKAGTAHGSAYAAIMVTPGHGVRLQSTFDTDIAGSAGAAPRWLKITRVGGMVTGFESADGRDWRQVGAVTVGSLPGTVEVGPFVSSPFAFTTIKTGGGSETRAFPTTGKARFDNITAPSTRWTDDDVANPDPDLRLGQPGSSTEDSGTFTVTGSGDVAGYGIASWRGPGDDDIVVNSLTGVQIGLMAVVALGVLFATSEYKTGTIRTTFAASPRRGRVLAAKAIIVGGAVFLVGLVASVTAFLVTQPLLRSNGYQPPAYPHPSLTDGPVLRAVVGTALFLAVLALLSLAIGMIRRRTVGAIIVVLVLIIVPQILQPVVSLDVQLWMNRLTPTAGLAIQQTRERFDNAIDPWAGFAVLCAWAAAALGIAVWQLRKRDA